MRLRSALPGLLVAFGTAALAPGCRDAPDDRIPLAPGTQVVWIVDYLGLDQYPFMIEVERTAPDIAFAYHIEHDSTSSWGRIHLAESAVRDAYRQFNFFAPGRRDYDFADTTTVWLSDAAFAALRDGRPHPINMGPPEEPDDTVRTVGRETLPVRIGGRTVDVPALVGRTDQGLGIWVADDAENPLILKFDTGWTLTISEVFPPGEGPPMRPAGVAE